MTILVTGAAGCLGSAILDRAAGRFETVAFDLVEPSGGDRRVVGDVADREAVFAAAAGCDAICHTAGLHGGHAKTHTFADYLTVNVIGVNHLYEAMVAHGIGRMVLSSTMEVVCGRDWAANGQAVLDELAPPRPDWMYPQTKYMAEGFAPYYLAHHGISTATLRYMTMNHTPLRRVGLQAVARWVDRHDAAEANLLATTAATIGTEVFHIGPDSPITNQDIVLANRDPKAVLERHWPGSAALVEAAGFGISNVFWPTAPSQKARRLLGWQPEQTFGRLVELLRDEFGQ